jgi:hypothetical protein
VSGDGSGGADAGSGRAGSNGGGASESHSVATDSRIARAAIDDAAVGATSEVDVRTLFEQASQEARSDNVTRVETDPARAAGLRPIDLSGSDGDADILDDDAFFATLRDAVHDEKPLGPREEGDDITGENPFFDQDADRGTFRDVFRRRR